MSKHSATTRRSRRVVWLLGLVSTCTMVATWFIATSWLERDTVSQAAPDQTALSLRFTPTGKDWDRLVSLFGNASVVTNRSLTIRELQTMTEGEFAIFFAQDGTQSVAIHSSREKMPSQWLDAQGIVVQETNPHVFLLSDTLLPVSGLPNRSPFFTWPVLGLRHIGTATMASGEKDLIYGDIFASHDRLRIRTKKLPLDPIGRSLSIETIVAATTFPANFSNESRFFSPLDPALDALGLPTGTLIESTVRSAGGTAVISGTSSILLAIPSEVLTKSTAEAAMRAVVSLKNPLIRSFELPDSTSVEEIYVDPSAVSLEELTISGSPVSRASTGDGFVLVGNSDKQTILTNDEQLLAYWMNQDTTPTTDCPIGSVNTFLNLGRAQSLLAEHLYSIHDAPFSFFSNNFHRVFVKNTFFSTSFTLCDDCCG